jgi:hypothetical protein
MNESAPQPEEQLPRYLLPDGCKDLIDALRQQEPTKKMMYFFDQDGNSLGPAQEIREPESVPMGLSALPSYVSRLLTSANPFASLVVFAADNERGFGLARQDVQTQLLVFVPAGGEPELEHSVRALFALHAITPAHDYLSTNDTTRDIAYLLPQLPDAITAICRGLLTDCFGVQPNDTLQFMLNEVT